MVTALSLSILAFCPALCAHAATGTILDAAALTQLELRAQAAQAREQCFLYTELVHYLTDNFGRQVAEGDVEHASETLQRIDAIAQKIHLSVSTDAKRLDARRLKSAEMLLQASTHHLTDILHVTASDDREHVRATLQRLDDVHNELLAQVFKH